MLSRPLPILVLVLAGTLTFVSSCAWKNVHVVVPGEVVRSAQPSGRQIQTLVDLYGIRSVLNLRGTYPGESWYDAEVAASEKSGLAHYDFELSSDHDVTLEQQRTLVRMMADAPKPLLIHCAAGADRTGLASALYRYALGHAPARLASKELSPWYGHVLAFHPAAAAMDRSFQVYVDSDS